MQSRLKGQCHEIFYSYFSAQKSVYLGPKYEEAKTKPF